jgi:oligopeptide/dipeptide ABC transporter ATP-binding protein
MLQNSLAALNPLLNMEDQIGRVLSNQGVRRDRTQEIIAELLQTVGLSLEEMGSKYAHQISGGQAQRVAMACALATNPRVLIADEPTTALDVHTELEVIELFKKLCHERKMGLVFIAHNIALISQLCKRVIVMHAGHMVEIGPVDEVFNQPLHPYTQGLIQSVPDIDHPHELVPLKGTVWGGNEVKKCCRYAHRCDRVWSLCLESIPPLYQQAEQSVRCFLYKK